MKPGVTTHPSASINCPAGSSTRPPADTTTPSLIAMSAVRGGAPVPSTSVPPLITTSSIGCSSRYYPSLFLDSSRFTFEIQLPDLSPTPPGPRYQLEWPSQATDGSS